ncbi:hypothetical protein GW835_03625 [archaeon]|nr:hypothetical protein [archaeon]NCP79627.1 hypothetical protein [archaeon]NCP98302.1 hypothetical protein [archaeon]NCQ07394.1 hypothetical protein [archaeon]NCQ51190.1 hypothetical protein [archaeon]
MNKLGHVLFATFIFTFVYVVISNLMELEIEKILIAYFIFIVYTLLPDIDKNNSWIRKQLDKIIILLLIFFTGISIINNDQTALIIAGILLLLEIILTVIKHRGPLHSFTFGILTASPLLFLDPVYFFAGFLGVVVHLLADSF